MNIYTQQTANIRKTYLLFTSFLIVIIGLGWVFAQVFNSPGILGFAVLFSTVTSLVSYWYSDKIVLALHGATPLSPADQRELYRSVENLCLTAGLPVPKIYLVDDEAPNAFATGRDAEHAVVAVTTGLLERLDRSELEGVLAHELSHIGNRDMLLSTVAVVLVGFVSLLSNFFLRSMWWGGRRSSREEGGAGVLMVIGLILSILAPIVATLLQLAISRKREFLADASGALLTRYPEGLASALEKISRNPTPLQTAQTATAHLWFAEPFQGETKFRGFAKLFLTHPPVEERIKALREMA